MQAPSGTGEAASVRSILWTLSSAPSTPSLSPGLQAIAVSCQDRGCSRRCLRAKPALPPLDVGPTSRRTARNALAPGTLAAAPDSQLASAHAASWTDAPKAHVRKTLTGPGASVSCPCLTYVSLPLPACQAHPAAHPCMRAPVGPPSLSKY